MLGRRDGGRPGRSEVAPRDRSVAPRAPGGARVVVITAPATPVASAELEGRRRETLCLKWEERRGARRRGAPAAGGGGGRGFPTGPRLQPARHRVPVTDWD